MQYPKYMTETDIMEFEYEYNRYLDVEHGEGQFWAINAELQILAQETKQEIELV